MQHKYCIIAGSQDSQVPVFVGYVKAGARRHVVEGAQFLPSVIGFRGGTLCVWHQDR